MVVGYIDEEDDTDTESDDEDDEASLKRGGFNTAGTGTGRRSDHDSRSTDRRSSLGDRLSAGTGVGRQSYGTTGTGGTFGTNGSHSNKPSTAANLRASVIARAWVRAMLTWDGVRWEWFGVGVG